MLFAGGLLPVFLSSVSSVSGLVSSMTDESEELNSSVSRYFGLDTILAVDYVCDAIQRGFVRITDGDLVS